MTEQELLTLIERAVRDGKKVLDLSSQELKSLPPEIGQLTNLISLNLRNTRLTSLPAEIGQLTNLSSLDLGDNQLTSLPAEIGQLTNLSSLDLWNNRLTSLPPEIGQLTNLSSLAFSSNQLTSLPAEISQPTNLSSLDLRNNQLTRLPAEIGQLTNLRELYVSSNQLTRLPPEIGQLTNLRELNLGGNQLTRLPPEIGQLINLRELDLKYNQLTSLPPEIGQLTNLSSLDLDRNQLTSLPPEIGQLTNLSSLDLDRNQLTSLPPEIDQLANLSSLDLDSNQLTGLPPEIGQLTNLSSLYLRNNQLTSLPPEIGQLTNLSSLYLDSNQLTSLPPEIGQLTNLSWLNFDGNQLTSLPPEIRNKYWTEVLNFLRQQLEQGDDYIYEAKLLIIGEGGAGKTTLAQKIQTPNYELKSDEESTEGIDVIRWKFPLENDREFQVNIWDFGGQEIYHQTHQFFLTERSLYALVVDTRKEDTDFYYWLNVVELLSSKSPLLIVKNEKQDRQRDINEQQLKSDFTNLKEALATNLSNNRGLEKILVQIKHYIQTLPQVGKALPAYWIKVRERLEKDSRDYISFEEFIAICKEQGFKKLEDILVLSGYLHDLGVFLHFQKDDLLIKTVILKPTWGTDAVYKVLDTKKVKENLGKFSRQDLDNIWQEEKYAIMRGELLRLMMNFKLCYEIPSKRDHFIAPQLLSANQSEYNWNENDNLLLRYEYEFMPKGILTRFIVEMHRYIENETIVWKTGVVLNKDDARAEVTELYRYHKGEIRVRVMGNRKRDLLTTVRDELDKIHHSYELLKYKTLVPCNCPECQYCQSPYFYNWDILNKYLDRKQEKIECHASGESVDVQGLVNDIGILNKKREDENIDRNSDKRVVVNVNIDGIDQSDTNQSHSGIGDNIGGNKTMSDQSKYNITNPQNVQITDTNYGEVNWNKYTSNPETQQALKEIKLTLDQLTQQHPNVTETEAKEIIEAEFTEIQTQNPKQWQILRQQLLDKERWFQGGKAALVAATEHYIDNNVFYKAGLAFLDEFSATPEEGE